MNHVKIQISNQWIKNILMHLITLIQNNLKLSNINIFQMIKYIESILGDNNVNRINAEQYLIEQRTTNTESFFKEITHILENEQNNPFIRQTAGAILKRSIIEKFSNGVYWEYLTPQLKHKIKNILLSTLISKDKLAKLSAADVISIICSIQLPKKEWPDIIFNLVNNTKHESLDIRGAAIMTLGFICEQLKQKGQVALEPTQLESIFTGIILGIKENTGEIRVTSLKALRDIMGFLTETFKTQAYRDFIITCILEVINSDRTSRQFSLQVLAQFVKINYIYLEKYLIAIFNITSPIIKQNKCIAQAKLAMQVWDSIATQYYQQTEKKIGQFQQYKNYIVGDLATSLCQIVLQNLLIIQQDEDDEQNSLRDSAFRTLSSIGLISGNQIANYVTEFVSKTISHQDWKYRQASLKAFCTLLQGVDHEKIKAMVSAALIQFMRLLGDNSPYVQLNTAFSLNKISQSFSECFFANAKFQEMLKILLMNVSKKPQISKHICFIFYNFGVQNKQNPSKIINDELDTIAQVLLNNCYRDQIQQSHYSLISHSFMAVMELFNCCQQPKILLKYLQIIILEFEKSYALAGKRRSFIQCGLLTIIQSCLINLQSTGLSDSALQAIYNLVINFFKRTNDVVNDGMYVLAALASYFHNKSTLLDNVWPYIEHALTKQNDSQLFKSTLGCIGDLARSTNQLFNSKINVMHSLIRALQAPQFDRMNKIAILSCIGDIFLSCKEGARMFFDIVMNVYIMAFQNAIQISESDFEYSQILKECLVESTLCIMHGLNTETSQEPMCIKYIPSIFQFVKITCEKKYRPTVDYVRNCLMLLLDISNFFPKQTAQLIHSQFIHEMIAIMNKHNKQGQNRSVLEFAKHIMSRI